MKLMGGNTEMEMILSVGFKNDWFLIRELWGLKKTPTYFQ